MTDIIGMGAALVDVMARVDDAFLPAHNLTKGHMHLIDGAQAARIRDSIAIVETVSGGSAANTCVGYGLFGGSAGFLGCVANDDLGAAFAKSLSTAGVQYFNLPSTGIQATGYCSSLVTGDGERTMCTYLGASGDFDASAIHAALLKDARMLYLEGYIWDTESRAAAADKAITIARANGTQVGFTLSDGWVVDKHRATFMKYLRAGAVDVLFANEKEACALAETEDFAAAVTFIRRLAPTVVLTRSEKGAVVMQGDITTDIAPQPVERVIDATGAGDLFAAGFLYGYLNSLPVAEAGRLGALAASAVISTLGARPKVDLKGFLLKNAG